MQPKPTSETSRPVLPSLRLRMTGAGAVVGAGTGGVAALAGNGAMSAEASAPTTGRASPAMMNPRRDVFMAFLPAFRASVAYAPGHDHGSCDPCAPGPGG